MSNGERSIFALLWIVIAIMAFNTVINMRKDINTKAHTPCACTPMTSVPIAFGKIKDYPYIEIYTSDTNQHFIFPFDSTKITIYERAAK